MKKDPGEDQEKTASGMSSRKKSFGAREGKLQEREESSAKGRLPSGEEIPEEKAGAEATGQEVRMTGQEEGHHRLHGHNISSIRNRLFLCK